MKTNEQSLCMRVSHTPTSRTNNHVPRRGVLNTPIDLSHTPSISHTPIDVSYTPTSVSHTSCEVSHMPYHRHSIRLKDYDYSSDGLYFVTICTKDRQHFFGKVANGQMILSEYGQIVATEWLNTVNVRPKDAILHEFVVMPNHFHAIVEICRGHTTKTSISNTPSCRGVSHTPSLNTPSLNTPPLNTPSLNTPLCDTQGVFNTLLRSPSKTLGAIVRGFKSAVFKKIGFSVWQRNYYEHIIRNSNNYATISNYIRENPARWEEDRFNNN